MTSKKLIYSSYGSEMAGAVMKLLFLGTIDTKSFA